MTKVFEFFAWSALFVLMSFVLPAQLSAQISVSDALIHMKAGGKPVQNVTVRNNAEQTLYVSISVQLIERPGENNSPLIPSENLLVSPRQFSIDGKSERNIRLLLKQMPQEKEEVYRIVVTPQDRGFGEDKDRPPAGGPRTVLRVLTGMGMLVFADPAVPSVKLSWNRTPGQITFTNTGTVHVRLMQVKACNSENVACEDLPARRVYPDQTVTMNVKDGKTIYFVKREGASGDFQNMSIPPG